MGHEPCHTGSPFRAGARLGWGPSMGPVLGWRVPWFAMARPKQTSRITPKGTRPDGVHAPEKDLQASIGESPAWMGWLISILFLVGIALIVSNYLSWLPGSPASAWILVGLGFILGGILTATRWR